jgi:membrane protease YdiL (CAAX protease family)
LIWYGLVILLATTTMVNGLELVNQFTNWFFLVLVPLGLLVLARTRAVSLRTTLRSVGLTRTGMKDAMRLAVLIMPLSIPLQYIVGKQQRAAIRMIFHTPLRAGVSFLTSFVLALLTAGFVEEFFFRGVLQSRLAARLGSEWRGLLVASFLFGLLHLPMYYFSPFEPTHGNLVWTIANVIAEQTVAGLLLGVVWVRTRNLIAPVLLHAFIDAIAMMSVLKIGAG